MTLKKIWKFCSSKAGSSIIIYGGTFILCMRLFDQLLRDFGPFMDVPVDQRSMYGLLVKPQIVSIADRLLGSFNAWNLVLGLILIFLVRTLRKIQNT